MRAAGALGAEEVRVGDARFAVGDHVVVRSNDRSRGVVNGDRGVVVAVNVEQARIELELGGRHATLDRDFLECSTRHGRPPLEHGYAIAAHLAQGMTCQQTFTLATDRLSRKAGYVALSRGRESNRVYALAPEPAEREEYAPSTARTADARNTLVDALGRSRPQTFASDVAEPRQLVTALAQVRQEHEKLHRQQASARSERGRLKLERPAWYRSKARAEHAAALDRATAVLNQSAAAQRVLKAREEALIEQLTRLRAMRQPERVREPLFRGLERGARPGSGCDGRAPAHSPRGGRALPDPASRPCCELSIPDACARVGLARAAPTGCVTPTLTRGSKGPS